MADDISAVKDVTASLVDSKVGTRDEPSLYVLVPFNDPGRMLFHWQAMHQYKVKSRQKATLNPFPTMRHD